MWPCLEADEVRGIYVADATALEVVLVDLKALPPEPGNSVLRLFDHRPEVVEDNVRRLWDDPTVGKLTKDALRRTIVKHRKTFEREYPLTVQEIEKRGDERRRRKSRQALLERARRRLGPDVAAELEAIEDDEALLDRLFDLLDPPRD